MKTITIGFSKSTGKFAIFSWLIMLAQRNNFSHAYLKYHDDFADRNIIFQASGLEVNLMGCTLFGQKENIVKEFDIQVSDDCFKKIMQFAIDKLGQPYSMLQILNSAIYLICGKSPFNGYIAGWDCSKLMADLLEEELGWNIPDNLSVITPKMLYDFLENHYGKN